MRLGLVSLATAASLLAAPSMAAEGQKPASDRDKMICKREAEIGSMIKRKKTCMTRAEWDRVAESQQTGAQKMVEDLRSKSSGN